MRQSEHSPAIYILLGIWAAAALAAIAAGLFASGPGEPSLALALQLLAVLVAVPVLYRAAPALRRAVDGLDPVLLTGLQAWRILGLMFLFLLALGELPAVFAVPAGVGDVLVGLAAPFVADRLRRGTLSRRAFGWFTALGLLDFVAAFAAGNYVNVHPASHAGFASMTAWPLVLVPAFFVPAFAVLHLAAWLGATGERGRLRRAGGLVPAAGAQTVSAASR